MNENRGRTTAVLIVLVIITFLFSFVWEALTPVEGEDIVIVPIFKMPTPTYFIVIVFLIPMIGSIIAGILLPRIIVPLFVRTKGAIWRDFQNAYVETNQDVFSLRKWLSRALLIALLVLGLIAAVIDLIDPLLFITPTQYAEFLADTGYPQYIPPITMSLAGFLTPIAFGVWAASWAMEDAGLVHYKFPEKGTKGFAEVEPVHVRFSSYVKGYAGLSSIIFVITIFFLLIGSLDNAVFTLLMPLYAVIQTIPGYIVYSRLNKDYLRKGLTQVRNLSEEDIHEPQTI